MKIDAKTVVYIGAGSTLVLGILQTIIHTTGTVPDSWLPFMTAWMAVLSTTSNGVMTFLVTITGAGSGPFAAPPTIKEAGAVMDAAKAALSVLLVLGLLLVSTDARAAPMKRDPQARSLRSAQAVRAAPPPAEAVAGPKQITKSAAVANPILALQTFTVTDLQAALDDANAQTPPDKTAAQCYTALIPIVSTTVANPLPKGLGGFQLLQKIRDAKAIIANIQSPSGPLADLNIACAPLVLDVQNTLVQLGIVAGGVAASGGLVLPISLPFPLPFPLP